MRAFSYITEIRAPLHMSCSGTHWLTASDSELIDLARLSEPMVGIVSCCLR